MEKNGLRWPQKWSQDDFFPTNPDLADILGRTDLNFDNFCILDFLDPKLLDFQVPRSQIFWISRSPDLQIPRSPNSQVPRFPDLQTPPPAPDELSDPNLTHLAVHPGIVPRKAVTSCPAQIDLFPHLGWIAARAQTG